MIGDKSILALIIARGGSKGVPRKNLYQFQGSSLLARTIKVAKMSQYIDCVLVSSEDKEILQEAKLYGAETPFVRPNALAQDETPSVDVVVHALSQLKHYDYVVLLQVTSPLRTIEDIDSGITHCLKHGAPACISIVKVDQHPFWMIHMNQNGTLQPFCSGKNIARRQDLPDVYMPNGAIFIADTAWFLKNKTFLTNETVGFVMPKERSVDIDDQEDLILLEMVAKLYKNNMDE